MGFARSLSLMVVCLMCCGMAISQDTYLLSVKDNHLLEPENSMYSIVLQKDGRGDAAEMVPIKKVSKAVSTDKATGKVAGMFPLKSAVFNKETGKFNPLPCLKVVLSDGRDDHLFAVTWSNHKETIAEAPGKIKLVRTDRGQPLMLFVKDIINNRTVKDRNGRECIDYVEMAQRFGSHFDPKDGWTWGKKQPFQETKEDMFDTEDIDTALTLLSKRFGDDLANEVIGLIVDHDLFRKFTPSRPELVAA